MSAFTGWNVRFAKAVRLFFLNLKNNQNRTSNVQWLPRAVSLDVRGSMLPIKK